MASAAASPNHSANLRRERRGVVAVRSQWREGVSGQAWAATAMTVGGAAADLAAVARA